MSKTQAIVGFIATVAMVMMAVPCLSSTSEAGAIFLIIFPGARPNGMAGVFTAIADDAMATYYNPAGLAFLSGTDVTYMHANWLPGLWPNMYYEYIGVTHAIEGMGVVGGSITYLTTGETVATDINGNERARFRNFDFALTGCYGTELTEGLGVGVGMRFIYSFLAPRWLVREFYEGAQGGAGSSWALDLAVLYESPWGVKVGGALQNIGPDLSFLESGEADPLPRTLRLGLAYRILDDQINRLTVAVDLTKILVGMDRKLSWELREDTWKGLGIEYVYSDFLSARYGYFVDKLGYREGSTYGAGIKFSNLLLDIGVDSALYEFPTDNYRFSLSYQFD